MRVLLSSLAVLLLAGCLGQDIANDVARDQAKGVVTPMVQERFPGLPADEISDCIIDNASAQEILIIAKAAVVGADSETSKTVVSILGRKGTLTCVAKSGALTQLVLEGF
ncbi:MAG: hypothetical protein ACI875_002674 [Planctomycetota bacterium]|jgi:hypothetical protein